MPKPVDYAAAVAATAIENAAKAPELTGVESRRDASLGFDLCRGLADDLASAAVEAVFAGGSTQWGVRQGDSVVILTEAAAKARAQSDPGSVLVARPLPPWYAVGALASAAAPDTQEADRA